MKVRYALVTRITVATVIEKKKIVTFGVRHGEKTVKTNYPD